MHCLYIHGRTEPTQATKDDPYKSKIEVRVCATKGICSEEENEQAHVLPLFLLRTVRRQLRRLCLWSSSV